jgi:hypothetical protein
MLTEPSTPARLSVHRLSQIDGEVEKSPVDEQPGVSAIEDRAIEARRTLDVCIYDTPAEGTAIRDLPTGAISAATRRIRVASMVTSSPEILIALKERIDAGTDFGGVYDYFQSTG